MTVVALRLVGLEGGVMSGMVVVTGSSAESVKFPAGSNARTMNTWFDPGSKPVTVYRVSSTVVSGILLRNT
ncbi:hypothetical protein D3C76_1300330 [compost metagenome]